jgi:hypothetical protein
MATFYLIPPRECLEQAVAEFLTRVLPSLPTDPSIAEALLAAVEFEANRTDDAYLIHREDLPGYRDVVTDLIEEFGAEPGDRVVEIGATVSGRPAHVRRCTVTRRVSDSRSVR